MRHLVHKTLSSRVPVILQRGLRSSAAKHYSTPEVQLVNKVFDSVRPKGIGFKRSDSIFLSTQRMSQISEGITSLFSGMEKDWLAAEGKAPNRPVPPKEAYVKARVNARKAVVCDKSIFDSAVEFAKHLHSEPESKKEIIETIKICGRNYWKSMLPFLVFEQFYEWDLNRAAWAKKAGAPKELPEVFDIPEIVYPMPIKALHIWKTKI
jgi:hypothetical protein